jgi:Predicted kinase related to dihydroxyacetone kinase
MKADLADGQTLKEMFAAGTAWLEKSAPDINAINVFPVPDGDTGTNMVLTMKFALEEAKLNSDDHASSVAKSLAHGALMGARGNSGVILSQFFRGLAKGLEACLPQISHFIETSPPGKSVNDSTIISLGKGVG